MAAVSDANTGRRLRLVIGTAVVFLGALTARGAEVNLSISAKEAYVGSPVVLDVVPGSAARGGSSDWRVDVAAARLDVVAPEDDARLEPGTEERM